MMKTQSLNMLKKSDGAALVEFALILPLLLLLFLGVFELGRAIHAHTIIANMSREGANLASRTSEDVQTIMGSIASTAHPLDMTTNGMIFITEVQGQGSDPRVIAQHKWTGGGGSYQPSSKVWDDCEVWVGGECNDDFDDLSDAEAEAELGGLAITDGEGVFAVEIFYKYKSIKSYVIGEDLHLHAQTIF